MILGRALGADALTIESLRVGGFLHDLGKIEVPDRVLLKPGPLDATERLMIERHPVVGENLVKGLKTLGTVLPIIRHHHERWDGSGYPDGLGGEAIPFGARIMAIVDVYDALITVRPYKPAFSYDKAVSILCDETDRGLWDPRITATFLETLKEQGLSGAPSQPARPGRSARAWAPGAPRPRRKSRRRQTGSRVRRIEILHHGLGLGHGFPAAVAGPPVARAAPDARDVVGRQAAGGELFLDQETKAGLGHEGDCGPSPSAPSGLRSTMPLREWGKVGRCQTVRP